MVNAGNILETQEKLLSEIILGSIGMVAEVIFFVPDQKWEAVAGWRCFSLTNGTVTQRSYSVSCVLQTSAKGQLQYTPALLSPTVVKQRLGKLNQIGFI